MDAIQNPKSNIKQSQRVYATKLYCICRKSLVERNNK
jgi:hypothetical protein